MSDCLFCQYTSAYPQYAIHRGREWSVGHVQRRWPPGSLFVFANEHTTFLDAAVSDWAGASPVFAATSRALVKCCGAERVYMLAFSENSQHFHFLLVPKRAADAELHHDRKGVALLHSLIDDPTTFDPARALAYTESLRAELPAQLAEAEARPRHRGVYFE